MIPSFSRARWALAVILAFVGGLMIASGMDWTRPTFAQSRPSAMDVQTVAEASNAFVSISESVTPAVVSITVDIRPDTTRGRGRMQLRIPPGAVPDGMEELFEQLQQGQAPRIQTGQGSGVIVSKDGYILTNNHVVTRGDMRTIADRVTVRLLNGRQYVAKVVGTDPTTDVAVLKIEGDNFPFAVLGDDNRSRVGEWVLAIGNPLGFDHTVTAGIISAKGRGTTGALNGIQGTNQYGIFDFIQTDAAINRGNSGGPLINSRGEVIGINTAIASQTGFNAGYGFAIPVSLARKVMTDIIEHGRVRIAVLGVGIAEIDAEDAAAARLQEVRGVKVQGFSGENTPAERAGVRQGDVIVAADGQPVDRVAGLQRIVRSHQPGETVELQVVRFGKQHTFRVRLTEAPTDVAVAPADRRPRVEPAAVTSNNRLGVSVTTVSAQLAQSLRLGDQRGVLVTSVGLGPAWQRLDEQDIIVGVLSPVERKIDDVAGLQDVLRGLSAGDYISLRVKRPDPSGQERVVNIRVD
ncbi:MAG: trypsin-like peptidase domain-containing protein [Gemmatimonadaceae bacterium]|nr:trypsin-like peptidase domain-containing protein [Gemmatimonadaceae bacterium]